MKTQEYQEFLDVISSMDELPFEEADTFAEDYEEYLESFAPTDDDEPEVYELPEQVTEAFNQAKWVFANGVTRSLNDFASRLNNNICVVGGSGTGKTTSFLEPNLLDPQGVMFFSDPKGTLYHKHGDRLRALGYDVIVMDFQHPDRSVRWNPLANLHSTQDILHFAHAIAFDTRSAYTADPFWDNANVIYLCALIGYMVETRHTPFNFRGLFRLVEEGERFTRRIEKDGYRQSYEKASKLADRFEQLHQKNPDSWAYEQFKAVDSATEKTYDSIRVTLTSKFSNFSSREIDLMTAGNEIDFADIAKRRTAVFVLQSDTDRSMDMLVNLFFTQAINSLIAYADTCENQRLPIPVRFFLDDYGATTAIENLDSIISTIRSRAISVSLILQSEAQLTGRKPGADKTILANCDTYIYMGGNDIETAKAVSQRCNKPLEQVLYMPVGHCWVFERGKKPVFAETAPRPELDEIEKQIWGYGGKAV